MVPLSEEKRQENEGIQKIIYHTDVNSARYGNIHADTSNFSLFPIFSGGGGEEGSSV